MRRAVLAVTLSFALLPGPAVAGSAALPPAPTLALNPNLHSIELAFPTSPDPDVTEYTLYRGESAAELVQFGTIGAKVTPTIVIPDRSPLPGKTYWYAVSARNAEGEGPRSETVSAKAGDTGIVVATGAYAPNWDRTDVVALRRDGTATRLSTDSGFHHQPVVSPDASTLAYSSERLNAAFNDLDLWLHPIGGTSRRLTQDTTTADTGAQFSPDGQRVLFTRTTLDVAATTKLMVVPVAGGQPTPLPGGTGGIEPAWSPNGRLFAYVRMENNGAKVVVASLDGAYSRTLPTPYARYAGSLSWAPDGRAVSYLTSDGSVSSLVVHPLDGPPRVLFGRSGVYHQQWSRPATRSSTKPSRSTANCRRCGRSLPTGRRRPPCPTPVGSTESSRTSWPRVPPTPRCPFRR
ncbi:MAG: hypothetical protein ACT4QG_05140 [Sporichthyaceae bacterium]